MKITRSQLRQIINEELTHINEANSGITKGRWWWISPITGETHWGRLATPEEIANTPGATAKEDVDDHSETAAEEAGMATHFNQNKDDIMNSRALALAQKIAHLFPQAGLGSVSEEELPILARHLLAVNAELDKLKPWNK